MRVAQTNGRPKIKISSCSGNSNSISDLTILTSVGSDSSAGSVAFESDSSDFTNTW